MINEKYWFKLLNYFNNKNYIYNGLTLPFIIGSRRIIEPKESLQTTKEFFQDAKNSNTYLSILKCDTIGEYVFNLSKQSDYNIYGGFENIVDIDNLFKHLNNLDDFSNYLDSIYIKHINKSHFSKYEFGKWNGFSENMDLPRLKEVCK